MTLGDAGKLARFEAEVLPHLDAAYNLARWLTRDESGADDVVQNACLRAFRFFESQHGASPKAWFMAVVRNAAFDWLKDRSRRAVEVSFEEDTCRMVAAAEELPEIASARSSEARWLRACIESLPPDYREVLVLRELEELPYREISVIVGVPLGTVMSRLARARDLLQERVLAARKRMKS